MVSIFCDIDGVLVDYPSHEFLKFLYDKKVIPNNIKSINEIKKSLSETDYKLIKKQFRESGIKKNLQPIPEAVQTLNRLHSRGVGVNIVTSRPDSPKNFENTCIWLDNINLKFGNIYFCRRKETLIFYPKKNERFFIIDDNINFISQYKILSNVTTFLRSKYAQTDIEFWDQIEQKAHDELEN